MKAYLKTQMEVFRDGLKLIPNKFMWGNYRNAWVEASFGRYMFNTILITVATVAMALIRSGMAGYVFGRFDFVGKKLLLGVIIATFVVPRGYTIIPIVEISRRAERPRSPTSSSSPALSQRSPRKSKNRLSWTELVSTRPSSASSCPWLNRSLPRWP